jgi:MFS family permease
MFRLLLQRSFGAMTLSQFLGAFNDNAFKQLVALLAVSLALPWVADHALAQEYGQALPTALFSLPFVLFCTFTGSLADRFSKSSIIKLANVLEIVVMGGALAAFWFESYSLLLGIVFLMGSQSALFGPSKYGSIGEIVGERQLSRANALIQTTTMIAIIGGIVVGGLLLNHFGEALWIPAIFYIGFATLGWLASL